MCPFEMQSLMKWYLMATCLVPRPTIGLLAISIDPLLSPMSVMEPLMSSPISSRNDLIQAPCAAACESDMYSASVEDRETTCCFFEDQQTAPSAKRKACAPIDFRSSWSPA